MLFYIQNICPHDFSVKVEYIFCFRLVVGTSPMIYICTYYESDISVWAVHQDEMENELQDVAFQEDEEDEDEED